MLVYALFFASAAWSAADTLTNIGPQTRPGFEPGAMVILPDGRQAIITTYLPDSQLMTDIGVILTPQGTVAEGPARGETVTLIVPDKPAAVEPVSPQAQQTPPSPAPEPGAKPTAPESQPQASGSPEAPDQPATPKPEHYDSLAELLPMTKVPEKKAAQPEKTPAEKQDVKKAKEKPESKTGKTEKPHPEKAKKSGVSEKEKKNRKTQPGEELRIPPEAAKSGNLDFLEGCWQGTRPEYNSKRTIRECFCFGANGKNGKRRVFDPQGGRQCIGASRATLSASGILSVTSASAACNDGERWGQAEMVCRNSGPRTPCTWVFRDANNGRQSYEIPFVRVDSCGR